MEVTHDGGTVGWKETLIRCIVTNALHRTITSPGGGFTFSHWTQRCKSAKRKNNNVSALVLSTSIRIVCSARAMSGKGDTTVEAAYASSSAAASSGHGHVTAAEVASCPFCTPPSPSLFEMARRRKAAKEAREAEAKTLSLSKLIKECEVADTPEEEETIPTATCLSADIAESTFKMWNGAEIRLDLTFDEFCMEPIFSGAAWAGTVVWSAALVLCDALRAMATSTRGRLISKEQAAQLPPIPGISGRPFSDVTVLELGSGVGMPGIVSTLLGAKCVVLTEQPPLDDLLRKNVGENISSAAANVACLDWNCGDKSTMEPILRDLKPDIILISDCVYEPLYGDSYIALADTIARFSTPNHTIVLNSLERRNEDGVAEFFQYADTLGIEHRLVRKAYDEEEDAELELYVMQMKA